MNDPLHKPYTREDIEHLGTLRILRDPIKWPKINSSNQDAMKEQENVFELEFVNAGNDIITPAYSDSCNRVYNRNGDELSIASIPNFNLEVWDSGDIVPVRCPDASSACKMATQVRELKNAKDSTGGVITCMLRNVPVGLGEPCFDKLQAMLAHAMLSLPAVKGFEIGSGFQGTKMRGSQHNDPFCADVENIGKLGVAKNDAGGVLGGISSGADIYFRIAVKAVSTIGLAQSTVDFQGNSVVLEAKGRHDPCVLPRCVPLVEAMSSLVIADAALLQLSRSNS